MKKNPANTVGDKFNAVHYMHTTQLVCMMEICLVVSMLCLSRFSQYKKKTLVHHNECWKKSANQIQNAQSTEKLKQDKPKHPIFFLVKQ